MKEQTMEQKEQEVLVEETRVFLEGVVSRMKLGETSVATGSEGDRVVFKVECDDEEGVQRVIGRRGQVLDSLQHIVNKFLSKGKERGPRAVVDAGGYREKHVERLQNLAKNMAEKATSSGDKVSLNPMSSFDRRIVHMALAEQEGVSTESEGDGDNRHVVVIPG